MAIDKQKQAAKEFAEYWKDKGYEKGQSQQYWNMLLRDVLGVDKPELFIEYEDQVLMDKSTGFIDGYIPSTKVMIEQKSKDKNLKNAIKQSDGSLLTPFQQAKKYIVDLPVSKHPKWVITCNFQEMYIYNMENPKGEPEIIKLADLEKEYYRLSFIVDSEKEHLKREMELSVKAGELVGLIYDAFKSQYIVFDEHAQQSLNKLCVRLVFCLYAEDADLFKRKNQFHDFLAKYPVNTIRQALMDLFKVLDTKEEERDPYLDPDLLDFPYVNGGLFSDEHIIIPTVTEDIKKLLLSNASDDFNWSEISPTIFGAVFESTLNPETRRSGGMHYTSIENIHKVIDPLFLDELKQELEEIKQLKQKSVIDKRVKEYQNKLASLTFLDPAAGSGNFLTETYLSLRKLENEALLLSNKGQSIQMVFGDDLNDLIKVHINQFYGIEINDFAVSVAQTALWIAEHQMMKQTEDLFYVNLDFLPLKSYTSIVEGNALHYDWSNLIQPSNVSFIMGNPPFVGNSRLSDDQKKDRELIFAGGGGELDYVACWYKKTADFIGYYPIQCAFVSTNSICQGQQVKPLWEPLFKTGICINFSYKTFIWDSEATLKAHVYCVIIGFSRIKKNPCIIFEGASKKYVDHINPYLLPSKDVFIEKRRDPLQEAPIVIKGFQPTDNGYLVLNDDEKRNLIDREPNASKWIRPFISAREYLYRIPRWCLWLVEASPSDINGLPLIKERVVACREWREKQIKTGDAYKLKDSPALMRKNNRFYETSFIVMPRVSGEKRKYIPFGFVEKGCIPSDSIMLALGADMYHFGVLSSNVHMAWTRVVCGRLKGDYRYSSDIVYNNFPWPNCDKAKRTKVEKTAQMIIEARNKYPTSSYDELYDEVLMPVDLRKAHQENDKAVMEAYGFDWRTMTESECVTELMKIYEKLLKK